MISRYFTNASKLKVVLISLTVVSLLVTLTVVPTFAINYGSGEYGQCEYGGPGTSCSLTISNNTFDLVMPVSPSASGSCTIQSDTVSVTTEDPDGYTLTLQNSSTNTGLVNGSSSVPAVSGTLGSPVTLSDDWGYRVDDGGTFPYNEGKFGVGPTTAQTNEAQSSNTLTFAQTESSSNTADTITDDTTQALSAYSTIVWYGICADNSIGVPPGSYSTTIIYTAAANS